MSKQTFDLCVALNHWMIKRNMTVADVQWASGLDRSGLMRKKKDGKRHSPTMSTCEKLAEAFGTDLPTFIKTGMVEE